MGKDLLGILKAVTVAVGLSTVIGTVFSATDGRGLEGREIIPYTAAGLAATVVLGVAAKLYEKKLYGE